MSKVHRYKVVKMLSEAGNGISYDPHGPYVVLADDYDAALAREGALREELATSRAAFKEELDGVKYTRRKFRQERDAIQQRLTDAEKKLGEAYERGYTDGQNCPNGYSDKADRDKCVAELLKPEDGS